MRRRRPDITPQAQLPVQFPMPDGHAWRCGGVAERWHVHPTAGLVSWSLCGRIETGAPNDRRQQQLHARPRPNECRDCHGKAVRLVHGREAAAARASLQKAAP